MTDCTDPKDHLLGVYSLLSYLMAPEPIGYWPDVEEWPSQGSQIASTSLSPPLHPFSVLAAHIAITAGTYSTNSLSDASTPSSLTTSATAMPPKTPQNSRGRPRLDPANYKVGKWKGKNAVIARWPKKEGDVPPAAPAPANGPPPGVRSGSHAGPRQLHFPPSRSNRSGTLIDEGDDDDETMHGSNHWQARACGASFRH